MIDLEITRICAEAMGLPVQPPDWSRTHYRLMHANGTYTPYRPLYDDAQAMALVKRFELCVWRTWDHTWRAMGHWRDASGKLHELDAWSDDLNRAICECIAKAQLAKKVAKP